MIRRTLHRALTLFPQAIPYVVPVLKVVTRPLRSRKRSVPISIQDTLRAKVEKRLMDLDIETSNICNAKCRFCAYPLRKREPRIMANHEFSVLLSRYVEYGGGSLHLTPLVGDPLLDKDLAVKIAKAKETGRIHDVDFYTNLIALDFHDVKELLLSGLDTIRVSMCLGSREMYERVYGVDRYEKVMQNLLKLLKTNDDLGQPVSILIHMRGEAPLKKILASRDYQRIVRLLPGGYASIEIMDDYTNWTGLVQAKDLPLGSRPRRVSGMHEPCGEYYHSLMVYVNGDVGLCSCVDLNADLLVGNLYHQSLEQIWNGPAIRNLREKWYLGEIPEICKHCTTYYPLSEYLAGVSASI